MFGNRLRRTLVIAAGCLAAGTLGVLPAAASVTTDGAQSAAASSGFVSYDAFIESTAAAQYSSMAAAKSTAMVANAQAFGQMRSYILGHYRGVVAKHSYLLDG